LLSPSNPLPSASDPRTVTRSGCLLETDCQAHLNALMLVRSLVGRFRLSSGHPGPKHADAKWSLPATASAFDDR